jgi:DNA-binding NarL/FixJ family response regulator
MVVVITDHAVPARLFRRYFTEHVGCDCATFTDAREAAAAMVRQPPKLLVVDLRRWLNSGFRELRHLATHAEVRLIPAIVMSAVPEQERPARELNLITFFCGRIEDAEFERAVMGVMPVKNPLVPGQPSDRASSERALPLLLPN